MRFSTISAMGAAAFSVLVACEPVEGKPIEDVPFTPTYMGVETRLLEGDIVSFLVSMKGARGNEDVADYGKCAAAQYALIRGYGFARHVRTSVEQKGDLWHGDAGYVISESLPEGLRTIDAEIAVQECFENGIPTV